MAKDKDQDWERSGFDPDQQSTQFLPTEPGKTQSHHPGNPADPDSTLGVLEDRDSEKSGIIGPYKLIHRIGMGGMGEVWIADQSEPVKRRVALKLIKGGVGSKEIVARFDAERQALALMNHPNIARILDAGSTPEGQPYFAMELVNGQPLTKYCDHNKLSIDQRLELFVEVCKGVQHAHQKGIIHRDLKPGNILVSVDDGKPVPKVIDFGLAKALESTQKLTDQSLFTGIGQILGTLKYMSPEQASLDPIDIDTRTDIYALGIVLYELLTGSTPLDDSSVKGEVLYRILEVIRDRDPVKPSSRLSGWSHDEQSAITDLRQTDRVRLKRLLAGDLDWIVMKALEKDRARRYESASGFAADVRRFLDSEPVIARPPSVNYRIRKFARKNLLAVIAASLILIALTGGIIGTTLAMMRARSAEWESQLRLVDANNARTREETQRKLAEKRQAEAGEAQQLAESRQKEAEQNLAYSRKANAILGTVFSDLDPNAEYANVAELRNAMKGNLEKAVTELEKSPIGDPLVVAEMQMVLGESLLGLAQTISAIKLFEGARTTFESELGLNHSLTLDSMQNIATGYYYDGQFDLAIPLFEQTLGLKKQQLGNEHPSTLRCMTNLAESYRAAGKIDLAIELQATSLKIKQSVLGNKHSDTFTSMVNLAGAYRAAGKVELATPILEETVELMKTTFGENHPDILATMNELATCYHATGDFNNAQLLYEETMRRQRATLGDDHKDTINTMDKLAQCYLSAGNLDQALALYEQSYRLSKTHLGNRHPSTLVSISGLAHAYRSAGKIDLALPLFEEALDISKTNLGIDHPSTLTTMSNLATGYFEKKRFDEAQLLLKEALALSKEKLGVDHPNTLREMNYLAVVYRAAGHLDLALAISREVLDLRKAKLGADHPDTLGSMNSLAMGYHSHGQFDSAIPLYEETIAVKKAKLGADHPSTLITMNNLAFAYKMSGKMDLAISVYEEMLDLEKSKLGEDHPSTLADMSNLASFYEAAKRFDLALPLWEKALDRQKEVVGVDDPETLKTMNILAFGYQSAGKLELAIKLCEGELQLETSKHGSDHPLVIATKANLAKFNLDAGNREVAVNLFEEAAEALERKDFEHESAAGIIGETIVAYEALGNLAKGDEWRTKWQDFVRESSGEESGSYAEELDKFGQSLLNRKDFDQAEIILRKCLVIRQKVHPDEWNTFNTKSMLGQALLGAAAEGNLDSKSSARVAEAKELILEGYEGLKSQQALIQPEPTQTVASAVERLILLYTVLGEPAEVEKWKSEKARILLLSPAASK